MNLRQPWLWWLVVLGAAAAGIRSLSAEAYLGIAAFVLLGLTALLATLRQARAPFHGLALLLLLAVAAPFDVAGGLNAPFLLAGFLCVAWLIRGLMARRSLSLDSSRFAMATLAFLAVTVLAFVVGQYPWFPAAPAPMAAQVGGLAIFLVSAGLVLVVGHQVASLSQLERLTWVFLGLGTVIVISQVVPTFGLGRYLDRVTRPETIGSMFWVWFVAISLSQGLFNTAVSRPWRAALAGIGVLALARGFFLAFSWVSGWFPPLIAAGVLLLVRFPRTTLGAGLLMIAPVVAASGPAIDALMAGESYSWMTRLEAFGVIGRLLERNPWLGFGPANYYHYTLLYPILGWWVRFNSHSTYIDLVAQVGIVGLVIFAWLVFEAGRTALALRSRLPAGFARAYAIGTFAALAASLVAAALADWIIPFVYNIGFRGFRSSVLFWFFLGGLLAVKRLVALGPEGERGWRGLHREGLA